MAIVSMKRLSLLALWAQQEALMRELMLLGCVEISAPDAVLSDPDFAGLLQRETRDPTEQKTRHRLLQTALEVLDAYVPEKRGLLTPRPEVELDTFLDESTLEAAQTLAARIVACEEQIRHGQAEISRLRSQALSLQSWKALDLPLDCGGTGQCSVVLGTVPVSVSPDALREPLAAVTDAAALFHIHTGKELHYLELICFQESRHDCIMALRAQSFSVVTFPGVTGTALEALRRAEEQQNRQQAAVDALTAELTALSAHRRELQLCADRTAMQIADMEAKARLCGTEQTVWLRGWIPKQKTEALEALLAGYDCAWELTDPDPEHPEEVPVALQNGPLVRPMNMVTEMYSLPSYDGIDPNPLMMPFFTAFFGIMLADIGYGLLLTLAAWIIKKKLRPKGGMANTAGLLMLCGVSCILFGALTGACFGDAIPALLGMYGIDFALPALINPMTDPMTVLIISLGIGVFQLLFGMAINAALLIRDGQWKGALFDVGSWWLLFAGAALGVLGVTWYVCFTGLAALILTQGRHRPTLSGKLLAGIGSLYTITNYFSDVLSYSRLMALMLAGSVIAGVVNTFGTMAGSIVVFIVVFIIGQTLNLGLSLISTFVHAARLQYIEYFGKFYRDGGTPFRPYAVNTQYVEIKEDTK